MNAVLDSLVRSRLTSWLVAPVITAAEIRCRQGAAIRARRQYLGLTLTAFAGAVGVSKATASGWESGRISPTAERQIIIASVLSTQHSSLFGLDS